MKFKLDSGKKLNYELLIIPVFENEKKNQHIEQLNKESIKLFKDLIKNKQFTGKFLESRLFSNSILLFGMGKKKELSEENFRRAVAESHKRVKSLKFENYHSLLPSEANGSLSRNIFVATESTILTDYSFDYYKEKKEDAKKVKTCTFITKNKVNFNTEIKNAEIVANATCYARDLVNYPPNLVNPEYLAKEARKLRSSNLKVTVFNKSELIKGRFNGILAVGKASANEPRLIILDYNPKAKDSVAFVGKGITFDSGGLNIKPGAYMETMKSDMAGAAAVLGAVKAASEMKINKRIFGVIASAENMPGGLAYRPDDIIKMYNGKTVEIGNTDAEGRLVLADALAYTEKKLKPKRIIDLATLTGACVVALGYWTSALMTKNDKMAKDLEKAGNQCGDRVWRLPLWDDYKKNMDSNIAQINNIGKGRDAGSIHAGIFLSHFVEKTPWTHLDIAGTAYLKSGKYYNPRNATGAGVRLLINYLEQ